ncbi:MAG TPA: hypothetical protein VNU68_22175 [Verrucomicrobiae bacterium]|nr:hypothetical protein [Verrucomicrobiae bacterium]
MHFRHVVAVAWFGALVGGLFPLGAAPPISLHPDNPHYFLFRGEPTVLISSAEHYGAVLNLDFDYVTYLATLARDKLNHTRVWTGGVYFEPQGAFNIARNTLAPAPGRFISPYARSREPGFAGGGNKFDLSQWDPAYFKRLHSFMRHASRRGVVVEMNLFCPMYEEKEWLLSPYHPSNNVNRVGPVDRNGIYTLDQHGGLLLAEEILVQKIVQELADYDNLYYEVMNEPYAKNVPLDWQAHIAERIVQTEAAFAKRDTLERRRHLISLNIANKSAKIQNPPPNISIFNFHYATPPEAVDLNYHLNKVIGENETGFRGTNDAVYRTEAWDFLMAGGALFSHLDYSFVAGQEKGTFVYPAPQPGGGSVAFRKQMRALHDFMSQLDFVLMHPDNRILPAVPPGLSARALVQPGRVYAIYLHPAGASPPAPVTSLQLELPAGHYRAEWIIPATGKEMRSESLRHRGGACTLAMPPLGEDVALLIRAH